MRLAGNMLMVRDSSSPVLTSSANVKSNMGLFVRFTNSPTSTVCGVCDAGCDGHHGSASHTPLITTAVAADHRKIVRHDDDGGRVGAAPISRPPGSRTRSTCISRAL